jgi:hypothetical protein
VALAREFKANKAAAEEKYWGKLLVIEGEVDSSNKDVGGRSFLMFRGYTKAELEKEWTKALRYVICRFIGPPNARALEVVPKQKVKLQGQLMKARGSDTVELFDCELLEVGPSPAIYMTAEDLAREHAANAEEAEKKYKGKHLVLQAVVVGPQEAYGFDALVLAGHDEGTKTPLRVTAHVPFAVQHEIRFMQKGEKVRVRGDYTGLVKGTISLSNAIYLGKAP